MSPQFVSLPVFFESILGFTFGRLRPSIRNGTVTKNDVGIVNLLLFRSTAAQTDRLDTLLSVLRAPLKQIGLALSYLG